MDVVPPQDVSDIPEVIINRGGLALGWLERLPGGSAAGGRPGPPAPSAPVPDLRDRPRRIVPETTNSTMARPVRATPDHTWGEKMKEVAKLPIAEPICHSILTA